MSRKAPEAKDAAMLEADAVERALADLSLAAPPIDPPAGLWARIAAQLGAAGPFPAGIEIGPLDAGKWRQLAPGVEIKPLWGKRTFLIRCQAGAVVPRHRHRSFEHTLILAGDIAAGYADFGPGDYLGNPQGWHDAWSTRAGCLVLVQYD
jgi:hypothetical protein